MDRPEIIADELRKRQTDDPTRGDLRAIDRTLAEIDRQQRNLIDQLANLGATIADLVREKMAALAAQRQQLLTERERILLRQQAWQEAQNRLDELETWCRKVAANLGSFTYTQKRLALDALQVQVRVWGTDHEPRWEVTASIPLTGQPGSIVCQSS